MKAGSVRLSDGAQAALSAYPWPGNVRELDNALQRALILQEGGVIEPEDFCLDAGANPRGPALCSTPYEAAPPLAALGLGDDLRRREFELILDTLRTERGRRKEAAERLGISPRTLRYKLAQMRDAGMDVDTYLFAS
jgi:two-component system response regulator FlrC